MKKVRGAENLFNVQMLSISLYVSFQIFSDVLSTKIAMLPLLALAVDGGTIIYPFTFTLRDFVHKSCGKAIARRLIFVSASINVVMVLLFLAVGKMPADPSWPFQGAFESVLLPVWRITLASIVAEIISELIDTEIFDVFYRKGFDMRGVLFSNMIALVIDSAVFTALAFAGSYPVSVIFQIAVANVLIKAALTIISMPSIKLIPRVRRFK